MCARKALAVGCLGVLTLCWPLWARAQPASECNSCVAASDCTGKHDNCVAECFARLFTVDPRRAACRDACNAHENECRREAVNTCRSQHACS